MPVEHPKIETAVEDKIDDKIAEAKLPTTLPLAHKPATTTIEEDLETKGLREARVLKTSGQRKVNLIWESTQGVIAFAVTVAVIYCDVMQIKTENLGKAFVLIIAIYFVRMNHVKTGGVGGSDSR